MGRAHLLLVEGAVAVGIPLAKELEHLDVVLGDEGAQPTLGDEGGSDSGSGSESEGSDSDHASGDEGPVAAAADAMEGEAEEHAAQLRLVAHFGACTDAGRFNLGTLAEKWLVEQAQPESTN